MVLIDLIVSLALIGIFSIPVMATYDTSRLSLRNAQMRTEMLLTAQNIIEEYKVNGNYNNDKYKNYQITVERKSDINYPQNLIILDVYVRTKGNGQLCCHLKSLINTNLFMGTH